MTSDSKQVVPPLDEQMLTELSRGDLTIERRLLTMFRDSVRDEIIAMEAAELQSDPKAVYRTAHRVKGAAMVMGAQVVTQLSVAILLAAKSGDWSIIAKNRGKLLHEFSRIDRYICARLEGQP